MDENEYRAIYRTMNPFACPFQKAVLARRCECEYLRHLHIAEREGAACRLPSARETCVKFLDLLRRNARFALHLVASPTVALPHGKEIKVQAGGLRGLASAMTGTTTSKDSAKIENVHALIRDALEMYGDMERFPYQEIVKEIAHFEGRASRRRRQDGEKDRSE
uniref:Uncharacterized protein n=1 Tax=Candidatus Kentrum sp. LPFa TaxID=2126335 RepID=A0A450X118_9GAMM|nr:MAG: hypothetical protein BECKLPF1236B_GA0070989_13354 [Candidatus Kentron sp. LPFa]